MAINFVLTAVNQEKSSFFKFVQAHPGGLLRELWTHRSDAHPHRAEVGQLKISLMIRESVEPQILSFGPFGQARNLVASPDRVVIDQTRRHQNFLSQIVEVSLVKPPPAKSGVGRPVWLHHRPTSKNRVFSEPLRQRYTANTGEDQVFRDIP